MGLRGIGLGGLSLGAGGQGAPLPAGFSTLVDFGAGTTASGTIHELIASVSADGTLGGDFTNGADTTRPSFSTANGRTVACFATNYLADDRLLHDVAASSYRYLHDDSGGMVAVVFYFSPVDGVVFSTMSTITAGAAGAFARITSDTLQIGMTPFGEAAWKGLVSTVAGTVEEGWHVLLCEWGSLAYAYYLDDADTPIFSGAYTYAGSAGDPSQSMELGGPGRMAGIASFVSYARKSDDAADRSAIMNGLLGLHSLGELGAIQATIPPDAILWDFSDPDTLTLGTPPDIETVRSSEGMAYMGPLMTPSASPHAVDDGADFDPTGIDRFVSSRAAAAWKGLHAAAGSYMAAVFNRDASANHSILDTANTNINQHGASLYLNGSDSVIWQITNGSGTHHVTSFKASDGVPAAWYFTSMAWDETGGFSIQYDDDVSRTTGATTGSASTTDPSGSLCIGTLVSGISFPFEGRIAAVLVVPNRRPSDAEVTAMDNAMLAIKAKVAA